jgi:hypothetical protein
VRVACLVERAVAADGDVGVQLRVELLDPAEIRLDQLDGRRLAAADELRLLERRGERELANRA